MKVIRTPRAKFELEEFLRRPLVAHLATTCDQGARDNPVWFLWEDQCIWIVAEPRVNTFQTRIARNPLVAVGLVDFEPIQGTMQHVSIRGRAEIVPWDEARGNRLFLRYFSILKGWKPSMADRDDETVTEREAKYVFIKVNPESVAMRDSEYRRQVLGLE